LFFDRFEVTSSPMGRTSDARRRLIDAAHELIWEYSYGAVTIDAICERAAVKKGSFYYFFDSKAELALVALNDWWAERQILFEKLFKSDMPPLDRLRTYLDYVSKRQNEAFDSTGKVLGCPLFTLGAEISKQDESIRARVHEILNIATGYFTQAIADAQALGEVEPGDPLIKARNLGSYYEGLMTRARIENNLEPIRHLSSEVLEVIGVHSTVHA
jgi:TetR/AcrR family transcriptional repressor of nem operon